MSLLTVTDLSLQIHGAPILDRVSFAIEKGQVLGLVGESGSGKSLTSLALMGLLPEGSAVTGQAMFQGRDLLALSEPALCALRGREIGMIFQEPMTALNPVQSIGDQVAEALIVHGVASRAEAMEVARAKLDRVGLTAERFPLTRFPHELSGGQRQRVCIGMAIALRPQLLIADEPTTALDVTTQAQILDLLKDLVREENMSLLLITHDLAVVAGIADQVAVMRQGAVVETGPTEAVFRGRRHSYTRALFAASAHQPLRVPNPSIEPLLCVEGVERSYALPRASLFAKSARLEAVRGVSFTLHHGESLGLVGESGCGKSTLTRAILGLEPVQRGKITLKGQVVTPAMDPALRASMQVVFQDPYGSFNPRWKVGRLVAEPFFLMAGQATDPRGRVDEVLEQVGLSAKDRDKYIHEFSGGQRQRIAIARALVTRPDLIVLDEAVSALDVRVRAQILDLLADLQKSHGLAYLFVSHDLHVVRAITDRVMVMQAGKIIEQGPTQGLFDAPQHRYTRALLAATPVIPKDWIREDAPVA